MINIRTFFFCQNKNFTRAKTFFRLPIYLFSRLEISLKSWQHCRRHFLARWPSFRLNNPTGPAKKARRKEQMRLWEWPLATFTERNQSFIKSGAKQKIKYPIFISTSFPKPLPGCVKQLMLMPFLWPILLYEICSTHLFMLIYTEVLR